MMYHGSLVERNGLDLAVDALARVRETIPTAELRIYGRKTPFPRTRDGQARSKGLRAMCTISEPKSLEDWFERSKSVTWESFRTIEMHLRTSTRRLEFSSIWPWGNP